MTYEPTEAEVEAAAKEVAMEIMELTYWERQRFEWPDHASGDTCDRSRWTALYALVAAHNARHIPPGAAFDVTVDRDGKMEIEP